jgi:hypothetical protein
VRILEQLLHADEEADALLAVDQPVVVAERQVRADLDLVAEAVTVVVVPIGG